VLDPLALKEKKQMQEEGSGSETILKRHPSPGRKRRAATKELK